jgi:hypothetical protein
MKKLAILILCIFLNGIGRSDDVGASSEEQFKERQLAVVKSLEKIDPSKIQLYLYSLDPLKRQEVVHDDPNVFYGFPILGKVEIRPFGEKEALLKAFIQGVKESNGVVAACFEPRHGLRMIQGDQKTDFVICYTCLSIDVYGFGSVHGFPTSGSPVTIFNQFLDQYHITKAKASP